MTPGEHEDAAKIGMIWKNATWLGLVPILLNFVALFSTGYITRQVGPSQFGRFSIALSLTGLSLLVTDVGLRALAVRDLARGGAGARHELNDLLSLRLVMSCLGVLIAWIVAAIATWSSPALGAVLMVSSLGIIPTALTGTLTDSLVARDQARVTSSSTFWSGVILTVASVIAVAVWPSDLALAASYLIGPIVNMAMLARRSREVYGRFRLRWRPRQWRVLIRRAAPFFRISIVGVAVSRSELPLIGLMFGSTMAGFYAAAVSLADRLAAVIDSVTTAALPTLMRLGGDARRVTDVLSRILHPMLGALLVGCIMASFGTTAAVTVVFGQAYAPGGPALAVALFLLPLTAVNALVFEGFVALRKVDFVAGTILRGQILTGILLPVGLMLFGLPGAPLAKLVGALSVALSRVRAGREYFVGLWGPRYLRPLFRRTLWALPMPIILWLGDFRPVVAVAISGGGFLCWLAATAHSSGVLQLLRPTRLAAASGAPPLPDSTLPPPPSA
ncbi:MAG: oligosaccharide flippase family protein [Gemmatimonadota bacterium]